jgi:hypothetical protein
LVTALLHQAMTKGDVKIKRSLSERLGQISAVLGAVQVIVQLEADSKHRVSCLIFSLTNIEQRLTKVATEIEIHSNS